MSETPVLEPCIPLSIEERTLIDVTEKAKDWAIMHGAAMRSKANFSSDSLNVICQTFHYTYIRYI